MSALTFFPSDREDALAPFVFMSSRLRRPEVRTFQYSLLAGRIINGVSVGICSAQVPVYIDLRACTVSFWLPSRFAQLTCLKCKRSLLINRILYKWLALRDDEMHAEVRQIRDERARLELAKQYPKLLWTRQRQSQQI
jgi:hypothetical protein